MHAEKCQRFSRRQAEKILEIISFHDSILFNSFEIQWNRTYLDK